MSKTAIQSSLVDREGVVTVGSTLEHLPAKQREDYVKQMATSTGPWQYWGKAGTVRAVFQDEDKNLKVTFELEDGKLVELYATHIQLAPRP